MKEDVRFDDFLVMFSAEEHQNRVCFKVYPIIDWNGPNETKGTSFTSRQNGDMVDFGEGNDEDIAMPMQGSYCWRGVWEGRLYFDEPEYWSQDLKELSDLFSTHIEPWCKNYIRQFYPHADE